MSEQQSQEGSEQQPSQSEAQGAQGEQAFTQEQVNAIVARVKRETEAKFESVVEKARQFDEGQEAAKSEQQKLSEALEAATRELESERAAKTRAEVSAETGVPADMLTGSGRDELKASADRLVEWRKQAAESGSLHPTGGFYSGTSTRTDGAGLTPKQQAAAALRDLRKQ